MDPTHPLALLVRHLTRAVRGHRIVDDVSFDLERGEVLAVVGRSGSGKSSLLRMLNRLDEPTGGSVLFEGTDARAWPPRELRRRVGIVTQVPALFPGSVAGNVRFGPLQVGTRLPDSAVANLLGLVGLEEYAERSADHLSGGEAQRVAIARALANEPSLLLLDEPTSALDEDSKRQVERLLSEIVRTRRLSCVLVTHDMAQATRLADRVLTFEAGRATRLCTTKEAMCADEAQ